MKYFTSFTARCALLVGISLIYSTQSFSITPPSDLCPIGCQPAALGIGCDGISHPNKTCCDSMLPNCPYVQSWNGVQFENLTNGRCDKANRPGSFITWASSGKPGLNTASFTYTLKPSGKKHHVTLYGCINPTACAKCKLQTKFTPKPTLDKCSGGYEVNGACVTSLINIKKTGQA